MEVYEPNQIKGTLEYGGLVRPVLSVADGGEISCGTLLLKPGEVMKDFEKHSSDEIFFIILGELKVEDKEGNSVSAKAGQIVYLPNGEWHLSSNPGKTDTVLFWVNRD